LVCFEWSPAPIVGDSGEEPVFDLVPFAGSGWVVADGEFTRDRALWLSTTATARVLNGDLEESLRTADDALEILSGDLCSGRVVEVLTEFCGVLHTQHARSSRRRGTLYRSRTRAQPDVDGSTSGRANNSKITKQATCNTHCLRVPRQISISRSITSSHYRPDIYCRTSDEPLDGSGMVGWRIASVRRSVLSCTGSR
jgi:hypothetical protein